MHHVQECITSCFRCHGGGGPDAEAGKFSGQQLMGNYNSALDKWKYTQPTGARAAPPPPDPPTDPPVPNLAYIPTDPNQGLNELYEKIGAKAKELKIRLKIDVPLEFIAASMLYNFLYPRVPVTPYMIKRVIFMATGEDVTEEYAAMILENTEERNFHYPYP